MAPIIIGIGGVSSGGKTTICSEIAQTYSSVFVLSMDDYYKWPDQHNELEYPPEYDNAYANFEVVSAINFDKMLQDLENRLKIIEETASDECPIVLVEGIIIFAFRPLQKYFSKRYFLTLPKDIAFERRLKRTYDPPDPVGYFEKYVWPAYVEHLESLADQSDIVFLDGSSEFRVNLDAIREDLDNLINSHTMLI